MINTAEIVSGHYQGSAEVVVECDEAEGTDIVLYKYTSGVQTFVGSGTIGNSNLGAGVSVVSLTGNIAIGNILQAYVDEFGKQSGQPVIVYEETTNIKTGWRNPSTVYDGTIERTYEDYFANGGVEIASKYAPESTINNTVAREGNAPRDFIDFYVEKEHTTTVIEESIANVCIVSVKGFNPAIGNPFVSWDGGSLEQTYQKVFTITDNGTHEVSIYPEVAITQFKLVLFTINISTTIPSPSTTDIWESSYEVNPDANRSVSLNAYSFYPLECRIVGLGTGVFEPMTGNSGSRWLQAPILNVPSGTYVGEIRVTGTTAVKTVDVKVTF